MKTLDEVIKAVEICDSAVDDCAHCAYYNEDCENLRPLRADALNYLYEYRSVKHLQEVWIQEAEKCKEARERFVTLYKDYQERIANIEPRNEPLTWDELRTMEGKPVWVEWISGTWKGLHKWVILGRIDDDYLVFSASDVAGGSYNGELRLVYLGDRWQAYRKERE